MSQLRIGTRADLPELNHAREMSAEGQTFCVANMDGEICAMDNVCPHRGGPLGEGMIENGKLICPWHAWEFDPRSGACHTS
jgi:nitrite reductase (NADH) small subunit